MVRPVRRASLVPVNFSIAEAMRPLVGKSPAGCPFGAQTSRQARHIGGGAGDRGMTGVGLSTRHSR
jgi:hypothetical protein